MKEYQIINASTLMDAEKIMNEMAKEGWRVVGFTGWLPSIHARSEFAIALERDI